MRKWRIIKKLDCRLLSLVSHLPGVALLFYFKGEFPEYQLQKSSMFQKKHSNFTSPSGHVLFLGCSFMPSSFEKNTLISFFWVIEYWLRLLVEVLVGGQRVSCLLLAKRLAPYNLNLELPSWNLTPVCAQWWESHPPGRVQMRQLRLSEAACILTFCPFHLTLWASSLLTF